MLRAAKQIPHSYSIHYMLGLDLMAADRTADAAEHLQWCATRQPHDANLRNLTSRAITERLRRTSTAVQQDQNIEQTGLRR